MTIFQQRLFTGESDLRALFDLIGKRPLERRLDYPSPADLQELSGVADIRRPTINLWWDGAGNLAGFALFQGMPSFAGLFFEYLPAYAGSPIGDEMLDWGEQVYRQKYQGGEDILCTNLHNRDPQRIQLLEQHAFTRTSDYTVSMMRSLSLPIPAPQVPAGYTIRALRGEGEVPAWVELDRAAFHSENMNEEYKLAMMHVPDYDPELDLVAVAPDGSLAAFVVCWSNQLENELSGQKAGYTDPVATHPLHQRRGLARALLLSGLRLLKQRGMQTARLGTGGDNTAMQLTAQSVGFYETGRSEWYTKKMR